MLQTQRTITINGKAIPWEGQGSKSATSRDGTGHVPYHPPPSKRDTQRAIYNTVYNAGRAVSVREIASALQLKKATWLYQHLDSLVTSQYLKRIEKPYRPNMPMYFYEVAR